MYLLTMRDDEYHHTVLRELNYKPVHLESHSMCLSPFASTYFSLQSSFLSQLVKRFKLDFHVGVGFLQLSSRLVIRPSYCWKGVKDVSTWYCVNCTIETFAGSVPLSAQFYVCFTIQFVNSVRYTCTDKYVNTSTFGRINLLQFSWSLWSTRVCQMLKRRENWVNSYVGTRDVDVFRTSIGYSIFIKQCNIRILCVSCVRLFSAYTPLNFEYSSVPFLFQSSQIHNNRRIKSIAWKETHSYSDSESFSARVAENITVLRNSLRKWRDTGMYLDWHRPSLSGN